MVDLLDEHIAVGPYRRWTPRWQDDDDRRDPIVTDVPSRDSEALWAAGTRSAQRIYEELVAARRGSLTRQMPSEQPQGSCSRVARPVVPGEHKRAYAPRPPSPTKFHNYNLAASLRHPTQSGPSSDTSSGSLFSSPPRARNGSLGTSAGAGLSAFDEYEWRRRFARGDVCSVSASVPGRAEVISSDDESIVQRYEPHELVRYEPHEFKQYEQRGGTAHGFQAEYRPTQECSWDWGLPGK